MTGKPRPPRACGNIIVISGPSGVGKTTVCRRILAQRPDIWYSVSATSRPRRAGERNGREYYFLSRRQFQSWIRRRSFAEWAQVHGHYYGTPVRHLERHLAQGRHVLLDVDVQGGRSLKRLYPRGIFIFIRPPSYRELVRRLVKRRTEDAAALRRRLAAAWQEIRGRRAYGYTVINDDLERTVAKILKIIDRTTDSLGVKG